MSLPDGHQWARDADLLSKVPVCSAIVGPSAGHVAGRAILSHFSVMVRGQGQVFAAGPPVVKRAIGEDLTKEELGGVGVHVRTSGVVDNEADDEADAFRQIRTFLSYLPPNVWEMPPRRAPADPVERRDERLLSIVPRDRTRWYDMRELISCSWTTATSSRCALVRTQPYHRLRPLRWLPRRRHRQRPQGLRRRDDG